MNSAMAMFSFFLISFKLTFALRTKTSNKPQEGGKLSESESRGPHAQHNPQGEARALDAKPSTQSPHMLLWPAVKPWYGSNLQFTPSTPNLTTKPPSLPSPALSFSPCIPVIYSPNDKTHTSTHSTPTERR